MSKVERFDKVMADAWSQCVRFNDCHKISSPVFIKPLPDSEEAELDTRTYSNAYVLPNGDPIVMVEAKSWGVHLGRVRHKERKA